MRTPTDITELTGLQRAVPLRVQAYESLKRAVVTNRLSSNERYTEQQLSELLGVSRTPVREALLQLHNEGWLEILPNRGALIRPISERDILEIYGLRRALEGWTIEDLGRRISEESLRRLDQLLAEQREIVARDDKNAWVSANVQFHRYLVETADNRRLQEIFDSVSDHVQRIGLWLITQRNRMQEAHNEHHAIVQALRDPHRMNPRESLYQHLANTEAQLLELYRARG